MELPTQELYPVPGTNREFRAISALSLGWCEEVAPFLFSGGDEDKTPAAQIHAFLFLHDVRNTIGVIKNLLRDSDPQRFEDARDEYAAQLPAAIMAAAAPVIEKMAMDALGGLVEPDPLAPGHEKKTEAATGTNPQPPETSSSTTGPPWPPETQPKLTGTTPTAHLDTSGPSSTPTSTTRESLAAT